MLDLGCGAAKREKATVGMDKRELPGVDLVHDMEVMPWPLKDERFSVIVAWHVFEHLKPWLIVDVMNECWRVLKVGGWLHIGMPTPEGWGLSMEPTHVRTWNEVTPRFFDPDFDNWKTYQPKPWKVMKIERYTKPLPAGLPTAEKTYECFKFVMAKRAA